MMLLRKQDRKIGTISSEIPKTPSSLRPFHPQQKQGAHGDSGVPRAVCVREGIQPKGPGGGGQWEPPHTPSSPFLPLTATTVGRGWRGRWHRALLKQIHSRKRPCACFPSNCDVMRDVWAFVLHPPLLLLLVKREKKEKQKAKGSWGQSPGNVGTAVASGRGDVAGARGLQPGGGRMGTGPQCPLGWRWQPQGLSSASQPQPPLVYPGSDPVCAL